MAVYLREHDGDAMLIFNNLSDSVQSVELPAEYQKKVFDIFTEQSFSLNTSLDLQPYSYRWLQL